jgi:hypothetical protein
MARHGEDLTDAQREELRRAFEAFTRTPFPPAESDDDEIDELRADLAEYDGHIAGIISTLVGRGKPEVGGSTLARSILRRGAESARKRRKSPKSLLAHVALLETTAPYQQTQRQGLGRVAGSRQGLKFEPRGNHPCWPHSATVY